MSVRLGRSVISVLTLCAGRLETDRDFDLIWMSTGPQQISGGFVYDMCALVEYHGSAQVDHYTDFYCGQPKALSFHNNGTSVNEVSATKVEESAERGWAGRLSDAAVCPAARSGSASAPPAATIHAALLLSEPPRREVELPVCGLSSAAAVLVVLVLVLLLAIAAIDIWRRGYSTAIRWPRLLLLYIVYQLASLKKYQMYRQFQRDIRNFDEVQSKFLLGRIRRCENSSYGREHDFDSVRSVLDFRRTQPVTDFYHFKPYVDRMADEGDKLALLGEQDEIRMFITSSGTTGTNKRIPLSMQATRDFQLHMVSGAYNYHVTTVLGPWDLRRMANIANGRTPEYTKAGYPLGVASTVLYDKMGKLFKAVYTSPAVALEVKSEFESHYIHMLFALRDRDLSCIICGFIHNFLTMMRRMKVYQKELVADVRRGRIKEDLDIPVEIRAALNERLFPMPDRANEIEREFDRGFHSIVPRLWPLITRVTGIWSGSTNEIYHREAKTLLGPDVPIMSYSYCASEGLFSMNMSLDHPGQPRYTLLPSTNFYEFLPIQNDKIPETEDIDPKRLLLATEVEVGETYEIGDHQRFRFYRYRVGDVVRVVDFYQQSPQIEFLYRAGQSLNVNGEKLSEEVFIRALRSAARRWPVQLQDFTVAGSQFGPHRDGLLNPHYLVFFEAEGGDLTDQQLAMVDSTLREQDDEYASFRSLGKIADMKLYRMPLGSFAGFKQYLLKTKKTAPTQFKMPRVLKSKDAVNWFLERL